MSFLNKIDDSLPFNIQGAVISNSGQSHQSVDTGEIPIDTGSLYLVPEDDVDHENQAILDLIGQAGVTEVQITTTGTEIDWDDSIIIHVTGITSNTTVNFTDVTTGDQFEMKEMYVPPTAFTIEFDSSIEISTGVDIENDPDNWTIYNFRVVDGTVRLVGNSTV